MADPQAIEQVVLAQLERRSHDAGQGGLDASVQEAVRAILQREELSPQEEELLSEFSDEDGADPIALVLGERIEEALHAGEEAAGLTKETEAKSEVLVVRSGQGNHFANSLARLRKHIADRMKGGENRVLLFAGKQVFSKVKQLIPAGKVGGLPTVEFNEDGTVKRETTAAIEVISADLKLENIEKKATAFFGNDEDLDLDSDSMRAAWHAADRDSLSTAGNGTVGAPIPLAERPTIPAPPNMGEDAMIGSLFHKKYRIIRQLGKGGFGAVYEAEDERGAGNRVAIKILSGKAAESAAQQQSFKDEARRVTRLSHPNIVDWKVFDETDDGVPYFVMELVAGEEFEDTLRRDRKIEPERAAKLLLQVLDALRAAHHLSKTQSILHLDLKPANLFRIPPRTGREEQLKVIDFGIGQFIGDEKVEGDTVVPAEDLNPSDVEGPSTLTFATPAGMTDDSNVTRSKGCTPEYASPEQCSHVMYKPDIVPLDGRSDLYSLGVMAFEMLTGRLPFQSENRLDIMRMHLDDEPPSVGAMGVRVPRGLAKFVERCLHKDRDKRWRNTQEAYEYLHRLVHPPVWRAIAKVTIPLVLVGLGIGIWMWSTRDIVAPVAKFATESVENLATDPLYLGPARSSVLLDVESTEVDLASVRDQSWRVVRESTTDVSELWSASWTDRGQVELRPTEAHSGRIDEPVELWLGDNSLRSRPMSIVWLGAGTWEAKEVEAADRPLSELTGMAVNRTNTALSVEVQGVANQDLDRVVLLREGAGATQFVTGTDNDGNPTYQLALSEDAFVDGENRIAVLLTDKAGTEERIESTLRLVGSNPRFEFAELRERTGQRDDNGELPEVNNRLGIYRVSPRSKPSLAIGLERPARVNWKLYVGTETSPSQQGSQQDAKRFEIPLDGLGDLGASFKDAAGDIRFDGRVELDVNESDYVAYAPRSQAGRVQKTIQFQFTNALPTFVAEWEGKDGLKRALGESVKYTNEASGKLAINNTSTEAMQIHLRVWKQGTDAPAAPRILPGLQNPDAKQIKEDLNLDSDGTWNIRVESFQWDPASRQIADQADITETYTLVLDRTVPHMSLEGMASGMVVRDLAEAPEDLQLAFAGDSAGAGIDVDWSLHRAGESQAVREGKLEGSEATASGISLGLQGFLRSGLSDGSYELRLSGQDQAGNQLESQKLPFLIATKGPDIALSEPSGVGKWRAQAADGRWRVSARALDANGVEEVRCELIADGVRLPIPLTREEGSSASDWSLAGSMKLPYTLSDQSVTLQFTSVDSLGMESTWPSPEFSLPTISRPEPDRLGITYGNHDIESMRLVRGNEEFQYLFGGRGDAVENPAFVKAGLGQFNNSPRSSRPRSWQIPFAAGEIESYYLDEHEVSVAQFREFLLADSGYASRANWTGGFHPDETERMRLFEVCAERADEEPMTGVSWAEAAAYAHWAGKRLPTWVEWEFAVRGGAEYRPYDGYTGDGGAVVEASASLSPRSAGRWAADGRFADLCGNVAEWTSTGVEQGEADGKYPHQWATEDPTRLMKPCSAGNEYWVAGGHYEHRRLDFSVADLRLVGTRDATIGFRCAVSLSAIQERLGVETPGKPTYEAKQ